MLWRLALKLVVNALDDLQNFVCQGHVAPRAAHKLDGHLSTHGQPHVLQHLSGVHLHDEHGAHPGGQLGQSLTEHEGIARLIIRRISRPDNSDLRIAQGFGEACAACCKRGLDGVWRRGAAKKSRWGRSPGREGLQMWPEERVGLGHASPPSIRRANAPGRPAWALALLDARFGPHRDFFATPLVARLEKGPAPKTRDVLVTRPHDRVVTCGDVAMEGSKRRGSASPQGEARRKCAGKAGAKRPAAQGGLRVGVGDSVGAVGRDQQTAEGVRAGGTNKVLELLRNVDDCADTVADAATLSSTSR